MELLGLLLILTIAVMEAGLLGWAVGTYWQLDAIRWYVTRLVPAAAIVHVVVLAAALVAGRGPTHRLYLGGMLLGLVVGLPVVGLATALLQRHFDRVFSAKPADLRALETPQPERVHAALDPERRWEARRIDALEGDVRPRTLPAPPPDGDPDPGGPAAEEG